MPNDARNQPSLFDAPADPGAYHVRGGARVSEAERAAGGRRAAGQAELILLWFTRHPNGEWIPDDVAAGVGMGDKLTSVRRAITNLTHAGFLVKDTAGRRGPRGAHNCTWKLKLKRGAV